jgi:hypothetical protein
LWLNMLPVNYLFSGFNRPGLGAVDSNQNEMNNLEKSGKMLLDASFQAKSLFWNILWVNHLFSIFGA